MSAKIDDLASGLLSALSSTDAERLGALLAPDIVDAARAALKKLESIEENNDEPDWSIEVQDLARALESADVDL